MTDFKEIRRLFNITVNDGFSEQEMSVVKQVCTDIPETLYNYYTQLGKIKTLNQTQDQLIEPAKIKLSKTQEYLIFYAENQWACVWGIRTNDLSLNNPPVYMSYDEYEWNKETNHISDFLYAMANLQAVFALPFSAEEYSNITVTDLAVIKNSFNKRNCSFSQWIGIEFYGNCENDVIAVMKNSDYFDLIYASNDKGQFKEIDEILDKLGG